MRRHFLSLLSKIWQTVTVRLFGSADLWALQNTAVVIFHIFLSCYTFTVLPALSALRQKSMLKIQRFNHKTHGFRTFSHFGPHIWNNLPQDIRHSATLSSLKSKQDISLLRIFQLSNIVLHPCQSVQRVCVCVHLLHSYAWTLVNVDVVAFC